METATVEKHKYSNGANLWVSGGCGCDAFKATVLHDNVLRNPLNWRGLYTNFLKADGTLYWIPVYVCSMHTSWSEDSERIVLIKEGEILADYDNKEEMRKYRGN